MPELFVVCNQPLPACPLLSLPICVLPQTCAVGEGALFVRASTSLPVNAFLETFALLPTVFATFLCIFLEFLTTEKSQNEGSI